MLKLKLQCFCHLMSRAGSLEKTWCLETLKAGGEGSKQDEIVGCLHQLNEHEFDQTLGDSEGQGSLTCCSPWGQKDSDTTEQLNNNNNRISLGIIPLNIRGDCKHSTFYSLRLPLCPMKLQARVGFQIDSEL